MNLVLNARDASPPAAGFSITIGGLDNPAARPCGNAELAAGCYLAVSVRDSGAGIHPAVVERMWEPFVSTKEDKEHSGLGLAMVAGFARAHPVTFGISIFGALLYSFATVLMPAVLGWVTDEAVVPALEDGEPNIEEWAIAAALIGVAFLRSAGVVLRRFFAGVTQARIKAGARRDLVDHYLGLPLQFHRDTPTGTLLAHADADTEMASMAMARSNRSGCRSASPIHSALRW